MNIEVSQFKSWILVRVKKILCSQVFGGLLVTRIIKDYKSFNSGYEI